MKKIVILAFIAASMASQAQEVFYDNGGPNQQSGNEMTMWQQAEDFYVGNTLCQVELTDIHFWTIEDPYSSYYDGTVQWWVYEDAGGMPGSIIDTGIVYDAVKTYIQSGVLGYFDEYRYDLDPVDGPLLGPGTYWLGLHVNTLWNYEWRDEIYWETTDYNGTYTGRESYMGVDPWSDNGQEHAFYLTTVPEPATLAVLGLGALLALRRRKL